MREITTQEISCVAGGSWFGNAIGSISNIVSGIKHHDSATSIGTSIGSLIGSTVDEITHNKAQAGTTGGGLIGGGIGSLIDAHNASSEFAKKIDLLQAVTKLTSGFSTISKGYGIAA